ncbi:hypothetical protein MFFC18_26570 [Mariniblastus fucicola]|uniref:Uncharacterized protein n=1 Tax=Mariniblastus fucicola TaxID=980251 RepID=A0A5B9P8T6_9BACT|nr:hypothetical protein MFFC18_26570 [Mariniblastus fucicola]
MCEGRIGSTLEVTFVHTNETIDLMFELGTARKEMIVYYRLVHVGKAVRRIQLSSTFPFVPIREPSCVREPGDDRFGKRLPVVTNEWIASVALS